MDGEEISDVIAENVSETNAKLIALSPKMYDFIERLVNADLSLDVLDIIEEGQKLLEELE